MAVDPEELAGPDAREAEEVLPSGQRAQAVQRVQVGLIGLGAMVLLVGLANIIMINAQRNQAEVVPEAASTVAPRKPAAPVSDPLADVGVVPDLPAQPSPTPSLVPPPVGSVDAPPP